MGNCNPSRDNIIDGNSHRSAESLNNQQAVTASCDDNSTTRNALSSSSSASTKVPSTPTGVNATSAISFARTFLTTSHSSSRVDVTKPTTLDTANMELSKQSNTTAPIQNTSNYYVLRSDIEIHIQLCRELDPFAGNNFLKNFTSPKTSCPYHFIHLTNT